MAYVEALTGPDIEFGRTLWHALRASGGFPINGMFWLFEPESSEWNLIIATPRVDRVGPKNAYAELADITKQVPANSTQLLRIEFENCRSEGFLPLRICQNHYAPSRLRLKTFFPGGGANILNFPTDRPKGPLGVCLVDRKMHHD